jgi:hypothetical protein
MGRLRWLRWGLCGWLLAAAGPALATPQLVFLLDGSLSMREPLGAYSRIGASKAALSHTVPALSVRLRVGLAAYGHRLGDCADLELLAPPESGQHRVLLQRLAELQPRGLRPTASAIEQTLAAVRSPPHETILVLISDGADACNPAPCPRVRALREKSDPAFTLHVIGVQVPPAQQGQLACLAEAGGGRYLAVTTAKALEAALATLAAQIETQAVTGQSPLVATSQGRLLLSMPAGAAASLKSFQIIRKSDGKALLTSDPPIAQSTHALLAGDYALLLNFRNPAFFPPSSAAPPIPFTVRGDQDTSLSLGAVTLRLADTLNGHLIETVTLRDRAGDRPFITIARADEDIRFQSKPLPAGHYALVLKLSASPLPLELIPSLTVTAGAETAVVLDTGFRLKPLTDDELTAWELRPNDSEQPLLAVRRQLDSASYPLFEPWPVPPGNYELWVQRRGTGPLRRVADQIVIQPGRVLEFRASSP